MHLSVDVISASSEIDLAVDYPEARELHRFSALAVDSMSVGQGHFSLPETMETSSCCRSDKDCYFEALDCFQRFEVSVQPEDDRMVKLRAKNYWLRRPG